jgi:hypothetical protein
MHCTLAAPQAAALSPEASWRCMRGSPQVGSYLAGAAQLLWPAAPGPQVCMPCCHAWAYGTCIAPWRMQHHPPAAAPLTLATQLPYMHSFISQMLASLPLLVAFQLAARARQTSSQNTPADLPSRQRLPHHSFLSVPAHAPTWRCCDLLPWLHLPGTVPGLLDTARAPQWPH